MIREIGEPLIFAADLTKKEYIRFYDHLSRFHGGQRLQVWGGAALCLLLTGDLLLRARDRAALQDPYFWITAGLWLLTFLYTSVGIPFLRRRRAAAGYDRAVAAEQQFLGTVTLTEVGLRKDTVSGTFTIPFFERVLYIETAEMQIFTKADGRAIVLPGRCLTPEDAQRVRETAKAHIPAPYCRVMAPVVAQRTERLQPPTETTAPKTLFSTRVVYEPYEEQELIIHVSNRVFMKRFPAYVLTVFLLSLMMGMRFGAIAALIGFWVLLAGLSPLMLYAIRKRYRLALVGEAFAFDLQITPATIIMDAGNDGGKVYMPWSEVAHAVEGEEAVELYNRRQYIYIPKRCIADMEQFRAAVDACRATTSKAERDR